MAVNVPTFQAGRPVSAAALNALRAAALSGANISAGPGISITQTPMGIVIAALSSFEEFKRGVIVAAPAGADEIASAIRYDVKVVGIDAVETGLEARIGRPAGGNVRLIPARVGDPCYVLRVPDGDGGFQSFLWAMTETLSPGFCDDVGGG